jgi:MFS family permease
MKTGVQKNIWKLKTLISISLFAFKNPIWILFFLSKGLLLGDVALLYAAMLISQLIIEVPSGIIGDKYGQRLVLTIAGIARLLSGVGIILFSSFPLLLIAMFLNGAGFAMMSGSDSSLMYDSLKYLKKEKKFKSIYGKCNGYMFWGRSSSALIGGFAYTLLIFLPFILDIIVQFFYILISLTLNDKFLSRKKAKKSNIIKSFKASYIEAFTKKKFAKIFVFSALIGCIAATSLEQYVQPYLQLIDVNIVWFGVIFAFFYAVSGLGSLYANKLGKLFFINKYLMLHASIFGIFLFILSDVNVVWIALTVFTVLFFLMGLYIPTVSTYINENVSSHNRTTMLSINSQIYNVAAATLLAITGYLSNIGSVLTAVKALSIISFVFLILYVISVRHIKVD